MIISNKATFSNYPTTKGIITVRDRKFNHLWSMWTDNIFERCVHVGAMGNLEEANKKGASWGKGRIKASEIADKLVFDYIEMPNTPMSEIKEIAKKLDAESLSKVA
jgi:hypothetical protein